MKYKLLSLTCCLLLASIGFSQGKWKVYIERSGTDVLGEQLAYKLKEEIGKNSFLLLVPMSEANLIVRIQTMSLTRIEELREQINLIDYSTYAVIFTVKIPTVSGEFYSLHLLGILGKMVIDDAVNGILTNTLEVADKTLGTKYKTKG